MAAKPAEPTKSLAERFAAAPFDMTLLELVQYHRQRGADTTRLILVRDEKVDVCFILATGENAHEFNEFAEDFADAQDQEGPICAPVPEGIYNAG